MTTAKQQQQEKNAAMEERIRDAIIAQNYRFDLICKTLGLPGGAKNSETRVVDRRLQSMRNRGIVNFSRDVGWTLA